METSFSLSDLSLIISSLLLFLLIWIFVRRYFANEGDWVNFAKHYSYIPYSKIENTQKVKFVSARFGISDYIGCLNLIFSKEGLFIDMAMFFKSGYKNLFIPWTEIMQIKSKDGYYEISLKKLEEKVSINNYFFEKGIDYVPKNLFIEEVANDLFTMKNSSAGLRYNKKNNSSLDFIFRVPGILIILYTLYFILTKRMLVLSKTLLIVYFASSIAYICLNFSSDYKVGSSQQYSKKMSLNYKYFAIMFFAFLIWMVIFKSYLILEFLIFLSKDKFISENIVIVNL